MSGGNTWNVSAINQNSTGNQASNQVGEVVNTINNAAPPPPPKVQDLFAQVTRSIGEALPPEDVQELTVSALQPLEDLAELPPDQQTSDDIQEQSAPLLSRLIPYAPQIGKGLATFGAAALESLATSNPIVAGLLAVCKSAGQ